MSSFTVHGPFPIPFEKRRGGRVLLFEKFWKKKASDFAEERGCYVFAIRNRALTPIYVGKATKSFKQEVFNNANKHKYHNGFSEFGKGTPLLYLVVHPHQKGPVNANRIAKIEDFLIQAGVATNPKLQNVRGREEPKWSIKGVIRSGVGNTTDTEKQFCRLFDIRK